MGVAALVCFGLTIIAFLWRLLLIYPLLRFFFPCPWATGGRREPQPRAPGGFQVSGASSTTRLALPAAAGRRVTLLRSMILTQDHHVGPLLRHSPMRRLSPISQQSPSHRGAPPGRSPLLLGAFIGALQGRTAAVKGLSCRRAPIGRVLRWSLVLNVISPSPQLL
ncbi:hypothetical protein NDU88_002767 [Pleurodeles waltl]|uniref:Uncharacterized protein n=1 Tax=Pleurodeles waltl TaxID=8319 RepID=A0AAV7UAL4_PLEWA|nr:hypothetical protein NDU88_002767 [Pleurodeles waltl]